MREDLALVAYSLVLWYGVFFCFYRHGQARGGARQLAPLDRRAYLATFESLLLWLHLKTDATNYAKLCKLCPSRALNKVSKQRQGSLAKR